MKSSEWFLPILIYWSVVGYSTQDGSSLSSGLINLNTKFTGVLKYEHEINPDHYPNVLDNVTVTNTLMGDTLVISISSDMESKEKAVILNLDNLGQFWRITIDRSNEPWSTDATRQRSKESSKSKSTTTTVSPSARETTTQPLCSAYIDVTTKRPSITTTQSYPSKTTTEPAITTTRPYLSETTTKPAITKASTSKTETSTLPEPTNSTTTIFKPVFNTITAPTTAALPPAERILYLRKSDMMLATVMDPSGKCWKLYVQAVKKQPSPQTQHYLQRNPMEFIIALKEGHLFYPLWDFKKHRWNLEIYVHEATNVTLPLVFGENYEIPVKAYFELNFGQNRTNETYTPRIHVQHKEIIIPVLVQPKPPKKSILKAIKGVRNAIIGSETKIPLLAPDETQWTVTVQIKTGESKWGYPLKKNVNIMSLSLKYDRDIVASVKDSAGNNYYILVTLARTFTDGEPYVLKHYHFKLSIDFNVL